MVEFRTMDHEPEVYDEVTKMLAIFKGNIKIEFESHFHVTFQWHSLSAAQLEWAHKWHFNNHFD
jgi:hypothetical protein